MSMTVALASIVALGMWTGLARAVFGRPIYAAVLDAAVVGLLVVAAVSAYRSPNRRRLLPIDVLLIAYVAISVIQMFNPNVPSVLVGLEGLRKTAFMVVGYGIVRLAPAIDPERFLRIVAVGMIPALLWSIRQFIAPSSLELDIIAGSGTSPISFHSGTVLRAFAPTASPFHLGILAGSAALIAVALANWRSIRWAAVAVIAATALGLSLTRANIIATIAALGVLALAGLWIDRRPRIAGLATAAAGVAVVAAILASSSQPPYVLPGSQGPSPGTPGGPGGGPGPIVIPDPLADRSLQFRFQFWEKQLAAAAERPLIGYGTSSAADGFDRLYAGSTGQNFEPHSIFLKILIEQGVVGFVIFLAFLGSLAWIELRRLRSGGVFSPVALAILVLVCVSGLTGPMLDAYPFNLLFWSVAGMAVRLAEERPAHQGAPALPAPAETAA